MRRYYDELLRSGDEPAPLTTNNFLIFKNITNMYLSQKYQILSV